MLNSGLCFRKDLKYWFQEIRVGKRILFDLHICYWEKNLLLLPCLCSCEKPTKHRRKFPESSWACRFSSPLRHPQLCSAAIVLTQALANLQFFGQPLLAAELRTHEETQLSSSRISESAPWTSSLGSYILGFFPLLGKTLGGVGWD